MMSSKSITQHPATDTAYYCDLTVLATRLFDLYLPPYLIPKISTQTRMTVTPLVANEGSNGQNILYLAYGSNLDSGTFQGRRGIKPISATVVTVPTLTLVFDLPGIAYLEPCFANVRAIREGEREVGGEKLQTEGGLEDLEATVVLSKPERGRYQDTGEDEDAPPLVGVVYEVTLEDYATIIATEGAGASYADILVECIPISGQLRPKPFKAHTLLAPVTKTRNSNAQASARYLGLITSGAAQHNLPESYRNYLARLKPYHATTVKQKVGRVLFAGVWLPIVLTIFGLARLFKGPEGKQPAWISRINEQVIRTMWWSYDTGFKRCFGDGEKTVGEEMVADADKKGGGEPEKEKAHKIEDMFVSVMGGETNMENSIASLSTSWERL